MIKEGHSCSFRTNLASFRTFRSPPFPKPVSWLGLFFAVSYSKTALTSVIKTEWNYIVHLDYVYSRALFPQIFCYSSQRFPCLDLVRYFFKKLRSGRYGNARVGLAWFFSATQRFESTVNTLFLTILTLLIECLVAFFRPRMSCD